MSDTNLQNQTQSLVQELRRGVIILAVLSQLHEEQYGYSLMKLMEDQKLLESSWRVESSRPRRYYNLSDFGEKVLQEMISEWSRIKTTVDKLLDNEKENENETH
jgi:DNA-binding PadR family transcriptional regulator